jgi:RNA-directed DNA polymerase
VAFPRALRSRHRLPICTCGDLGWKKRGLETRLGARIVSYADDYVICCKGTAEQAMTETRRLMTQLKLTINEAKTDIRQLPQ